MHRKESRAGYKTLLSDLDLLLISDQFLTTYVFCSSTVFHGNHSPCNVQRTKLCCSYTHFVLVHRRHPGPSTVGTRGVFVQALRHDSTALALARQLKDTHANATHTCRPPVICTARVHRSRSELDCPTHRSLLLPAS